MNLGAALAKLNQKVLLIDSDPQANLTSYLGVTPGRPPYESLRTLDEAYLSKRVQTQLALREWITPTASGVDLLPCDAHLSGVEYYLFQRSDRESILRQWLDAIQQTFHYDLILIDTPPSANLLTVNALVASDRVLIPVQPEFFSLEGIVKIRESLTQIRNQWNPRLEILGILPTQVSQRRKLTHEVIQALRQELGDALFESQIHDTASLTESTGHAQSIFGYDPRSVGAKDYLAAAQEILSRLKKQKSTPSPSSPRSPTL